MPRLYFALWPTAAMQRELEVAAEAALRSPHGGREVPAANLHVTVAFLGSVPEPAVVRARGSAAAASRAYGAWQASGAVPREVSVTFDTLVHWRRSQILCATASHEAAGAARLAAALREALIDAGLAPDPKPFRAHVTLARQVRRGPSRSEMPHVTWTFRELALVESRTDPGGALYSVFESWPLCRA